jgi:hypothetical protein
MLLLLHFSIAAFLLRAACELLLLLLLLLLLPLPFSVAGRRRRRRAILPVLVPECVEDARSGALAQRVPARAPTGVTAIARTPAAATARRRRRRVRQSRILHIHSTHAAARRRSRKRRRSGGRNLRRRSSRSHGECGSQDDLLSMSFECNAFFRLGEPLLRERLKKNQARGGSRTCTMPNGQCHQGHKELRRRTPYWLSLSYIFPDSNPQFVSTSSLSDMTS